MTNIFTAIPAQLPNEQFDSLLKQDGVHIERIVSQGHTTAAEHWYNQAWDEWILLLAGQATLRYQHHPQPFQLNVGDYLLIPAHTAHRVEWTAPDVDTIWLAIHLYRE